MIATEVCIIRHGETDWNVEKRIQGHIDIPLNSNGLAQAGAAAKGLVRHQFAAVYSSDLDRAWQTAKASADQLNLPLQAVAGLRERHFGALQGLTSTEIAEQLPHLHQPYLSRHPDHDFEGGESLLAFARRIVATVEELAARHSGQAVLLVAHGGVLDICYRHAIGRLLTAPRDYPIPNAAINWFDIAGRDWRLRTWADQSHLEQARDEVTA